MTLQQYNATSQPDEELRSSRPLIHLVTLPTHFWSYTVAACERRKSCFKKWNCCRKHASSRSRWRLIECLLRRPAESKHSTLLIALMLTLSTNDPLYLRYHADHGSICSICHLKPDDVSDAMSSSQPWAEEGRSSSARQSLSVVLR